MPSVSETAFRQTILDMRHAYPKGTRVELVHMDDAHAPVVGCTGTVSHVDDMGTVHIVWNDGSTLGAVLDVDVIRKVTE